MTAATHPDQPGVRPLTPEERRIKRALALLATCLNDSNPWSEGRLVGRMEKVFEALGGRIEGGEARRD